MATAQFTVRELLEWTGGRLANGAELGARAEAIRVARPSTLAASKPDEIAFFFSREYEGELPQAHAGVLLTGEDFVVPLSASGLPLWKTAAVIACKDPYYAMSVLSEKFAAGLSSVAHLSVPMASDASAGPCVHSTAIVDATAEIGPGATIGAYCVIERGARVGAGSVLYPHCYLGERVVLGSGCVLFPRVTLYEWTELGDRVRIHAGAVIGADGFGYAPKRENGQPVGHQKIYHLGRVVIGDDVEIGANTCIDRATFGETKIGRMAKIDDQVMVGHNVKVGEGAILCGGVGVAGSAQIGDFALILGNAGLVNQVRVGAGATVGAHTCVTKDVPAKASVAGYPQRDFKEHFRIHALLNRLLDERMSKRKKV